MWNEYDAAETLDAKFANVIDRTIPMLLNLHNQGQSWVENNIRLGQVIARNEFIEEVFPEFWEQLLPQLEAAQQKGWLL